MQAGVDSNDTLLLKDVWRAWTPELAGLFGIPPDHRQAGEQGGYNMTNRLSSVRALL